MKLKSFLPERWYHKYIKPLQIHYTQSKGKRIYSQEGEDVLIEKLIGEKKKGFYIDIGAHHPLRFSNSYYFYRQGWSGINIEPNPELFKFFLKYRRRDINLNIGLSNKTQELKYHYFEEPAYNTFVEDRAFQLVNEKQKLLRTEIIPTTSLPLALKGLNIPDRIDFMSVDTEGMDLEIIQSNDWNIIRPVVLLLEIKTKNLNQVLDSELSQFLKSKDYEAISRLNNSVAYMSVKK